MTIRTIKFRLYPKRKQEKRLELFLDGCRFTYNYLLERTIKEYEENKKHLSRFDYNYMIKPLKDSEPWLKEVYSTCLCDAGYRLSLAFDGFFRRCKTGETPGFPRFKSKNRYDSFTYEHNADFSIEGNKIRLGKIGQVRMSGFYGIQGVMKTCTIRRDLLGKWYGTISYESEIIEKNAIVLGECKEDVCIDLGISALATCSDGRVFENHRLLEGRLERIGTIQKKMASVKDADVQRYYKYKRHLEHDFEHLNNERTDHINKISRELSETCSMIAMENLDIKNMLEDQDKGHTLNRRISDASWNRLTNKIRSAAEDAMVPFVLVDPRNTSQLCSRCGTYVRKELSIRRHMCPVCGLNVDRDMNSAYIIRGLGRETVALSQESSVLRNRHLG